MSQDITKEQVLKEWTERHNKLKPYVYDILSKRKNLNNEIVIRGYGRLTKKIESVVRILKEFLTVYNEQEDKTLPIPYNKFSDATREYMKLFARGVVSATELFSEMINIYIPELKDVRIAHVNHNKVIKSEEFLDSELKGIVDKLNLIAIDGNIDSLFSGEHEEYLRYLSRLFLNKNISFDEFIMKYTNLDYTRCYSVDTITATKQMIQDFYDEFNTTIGIKKLDTYLYSKIIAGERLTNTHNIKDYIKLLGLYADNNDTKSGALTKKDIDDREELLISELERIYPNKFIELNFTKDYPHLYDLMINISKRKGFMDVNDYISTLGFDRDLNYVSKARKSRIVLSENDIVAYGFLNEYDGSVDLEEWLEERFGMKLINPIKHAGENSVSGLKSDIYKKLGLDKKDCVYTSERKRKSRENTERFVDIDDAGPKPC